MLGQGTFGLVLEAWDRVEQKYVALKIVRAVKKYTDSAHIEIEILTKIQRSYSESKRNATAAPVDEIPINLSGEESEEKHTKSDSQNLRTDIPTQYVFFSQLTEAFLFVNFLVHVHD